jgi:outer membrane protein assembly factor BamB
MLCASAILASAEASATSFIPRDDLALVALDARTAERRWAHFPEALSEATCELHPDLLVVNGWAMNPSTFTEKKFVLALDPATGAPREGSPGATPLARSSTFYVPEVRLANGWRLDLDPGYDKQLDFVDDMGAVAWTITPMPEMYPHQVDAWKNTVFFAEEYLADDATVYAYEAGAIAPSWTFDPNAIVGTTATRTVLRVLGDDLYVGLHEHIFQLDPASGAVERQWNLSTLTGLPFEGDLGKPSFFRGGIEAGTFAGDALTLVIGFENRVVAIDRKSGDLLWHEDPGSFPSFPYPLVHEGTLILTAGEPLAGPRPPPPPAPQLNPGGCALSGGAEGAGASAAALILTLFLGIRRRTSGRRKEGT